MPELEHRPAETPSEEVCEILARDGALILEGVLSPAEVAHAVEELRPYIDATETGRDDFTGKFTKRTGALVARSSASRDMIVHDAILPAARKFLEPWCDTIQLHLSQVITIQPGQGEQLSPQVSGESSGTHSPSHLWKPGSHSMTQLAPAHTPKPFGSSGQITHCPPQLAVPASHS